jgi:hypothetical protein
MIVVARIPATGRTLVAALRELVYVHAQICAALMSPSAGLPTLPPLYQSGVEYRPEPNRGSGVEDFADPWTCFARKWGDCDDLVIWRLAELIHFGERVPAPQVRRAGARMHVLVRRVSGKLEDPSRILYPKHRKGPAAAG